MSKIYRTAKGQKVDVEMLMRNGEGSVAVGNMNTNGRGDLLGPGGVIKKRREEVVQEYHREDIPETQQVSLKKDRPIAADDEQPYVTPQHETPERFETPQEAMQRVQKEKQEQMSSQKPKKKSNKNSRA